MRPCGLVSALASGLAGDPMGEGRPRGAIMSNHLLDESARAANTPWATVSWLFLIEPLGACRCRFVSRFRSDYSSDFATRLAFGPLFGEPVGFAMDRRMLLGVKALSEQSWSAVDLTSRLTGC